LVYPVIFFVKTHKDHPFDPRPFPKGVPHRGDGDHRRFFPGIPIDPGADVRKGKALKTLFGGNEDAFPVTGSQQGGLPGLAVLPNRAHGVDHPLAGEPVRAGEYRLSGGTGPVGQPLSPSGNPPALRQKFRSRRPVDGAVHAPAPQKPRIGGVYYHINRNFGNVPPDQFYLRRYLRRYFRWYFRRYLRHVLSPYWIHPASFQYNERP
jgi:hypothetical protein